MFSALLTVMALLQIFEGVVNLLDRLQAWHSTPGSPGHTELKEMAQIGLRIITGYIQQQHSQVSRTPIYVYGSPVKTPNIFVLYFPHNNPHTCRSFTSLSQSDH